MAVTRALCRKKLAELLTGITPEAQLVIHYQKSQLNGVSPTVMVTSVGSTRKRFTARGIRATFHLAMHIFVLHSDANSGWTEENAEDALDTIEMRVAQLVEQFSDVNGYWKDLTWNGDTLVDKVVLEDGLAYLYEVVPLLVEVY